MPFPSGTNSQRDAFLNVLLKVLMFNQELESDQLRTLFMRMPTLPSRTKRFVSKNVLLCQFQCARSSILSADPRCQNQNIWISITIARKSMRNTNVKNATTQASNPLLILQEPNSTKREIAIREMCVLRTAEKALQRT